MSEELESRAANARQRLAEWDERHSGPKKFDHGMLQLTRRQRNGKLGFDSLAIKRGELQHALDNAEAKVMRAKADAEAPAIRERKEAVHASADLKAIYGDCSEALWTMSGSWLPVIRWNKKTVTVRMAGEADTIPHTQVGGGR